MIASATTITTVRVNLWASVRSIRPFLYCLLCAGGLSAIAILIGSRVADVPAQPQPPGPNHDQEAMPRRCPEQRKRVSFHVILDVALLRVAWEENGRRRTGPNCAPGSISPNGWPSRMAQAGHIERSYSLHFFQFENFPG
jgi:hypothetical protein